MHRPIALALVLCAPLVTAFDGCAADGINTPVDDDPNPVLTEIEASLLDTHNAVRSDVTPAPDTPLPPLVWSTSLAAVAQAWADACVFEHSDNDFGENLSLLSPRDLNGDTAASVVRGWASEDADYTYDSNRCAAGRVCGHYTQIVWRDSARVGCAVSECNNVAGFGAGSLWVCNYDPPGNFVGEKPY